MQGLKLLTEVPGYKAILKAVIQSQIQTLVCPHKPAGDKLIFWQDGKKKCVFIFMFFTVNFGSSGRSS